MSAPWVWLLILCVFAVGVRAGQRAGLLPIVSQLLVAAVGLPLLVVWVIEPYWAPGVAALVTTAWLKWAYSLAFALLLQRIVGEALGTAFDRRSLLIALPSFAVPCLVGIGCALWWLPELSRLGQLSLGLVFAITAIPVLYLYLKHIGYPPEASRLLLQAAMLIDLACWSLFGIASGLGRLNSALVPVLAAFSPWLLYALGVRRPRAYALCLFAWLVAAEHYALNALLLGMGFVLNQAWLKVPLAWPLPERWAQPLQNGVAIPLLLACGVLKVDLHSALGALRPDLWLALLLAPMLAKIAGSWLGLRWAGLGEAAPKAALLLNIRGLSEIVFLNLLLGQHLISPPVYLALMLMSLVATLLPALLGLGRARHPLPVARRPHVEP